MANEKNINAVADEEKLKDNATAEENSKKLQKEQELARKQQEQEALERKKQLKEQKNKAALDNNLDLRKKQISEKHTAKKNIIINSIILLVGTGLALFLMSINKYLIAIALPVWGYTIFNIIKAIRLLPKLGSAYELRRMLIIEQAKKEHIEKNAKIIDAYKQEKKRIKTLKKLPYKILNSIALIFSMFVIILFFFVFDTGIQTTAIVLLGVFTVVYFIVGLLMLAVFYMISENKQRQEIIRLEEEKNRLLYEEKIRDEEVIRMKLEKERRKHEEEERLRIEEILRIEQEEEALSSRLSEEKRLHERFEIERNRFLRKSNKFSQDALPQFSKAEIAREVETIRNEFDKKILNDIAKNIDTINISGIEEFTDKKKIDNEYTINAIFPEFDIHPDTVKKEMDNILLDIEKVNNNPLTDFETTDIEEAKNLIFEKAVQNKAQAEETSQGKHVNAKSFMAIKQMLKDH